MSYNEPPPPPPQYGQPAYGGDQPVGTSKKATWSLVSGIAALLCCGPLGILAIVLGRQAQAEIATTGQQGAGLAKAGFILGIVALVFLVVQVIVLATGAVSFDGSFSTS